MGYNICGFITDQSFNLIQPKVESVLGVHFEKEEIITLSEGLSDNLETSSWTFMKRKVLPCYSVIIFSFQMNQNLVL